MKQFFLLLLALLIISPTAVNAQTQSAGSAPAPDAPQSGAMRILPIPPEQPLNIFGQNHFYTLTLRGNGEAVVTFKAILSNTGTTPLETVSLQLPENVSPAEIMAYQVIQEPQCIRYLPSPLPEIKTQDSMLRYSESCAEYQQPNYQYVYGNTTYQHIQSETQNNTVLLKLPTPIEPNKDGSYFVYFRSNSMVQQDMFGAYSYNFKTLKTEDKIQSLQVGISTDADYLLRGAQADVNYASGVAMAALPAADGAERGIRSAQFDQFYNQIGSGTLMKNASNLAPLETYEVKGMYADSQAKLYGKEIMTGVVIVLVFVILAIITIRVIMKKLARKKADKPEDAVVQLRNQNKTFLIALSISFVSMLLVCLYTLGVYAIMPLLNPTNYIGSDYMALQLFVLAISGLVYLFFFFAPAVGMAIKKGLGWGLVTFSATVVWAILFLLVLFALLLLLQSPRGGYPKAFPLMNMMEGRAVAPAVDLVQPAPPAAAEPATDLPATEPQTLELKTTESKAVESGPVPPTTAEFKPAGRVEILNTTQ